MGCPYCRQAQVEQLLAENARLRAELATANSKLATSEARAEDWRQAWNVEHGALAVAHADLAACQERERGLFHALAGYGSHHRNCSRWQATNGDCDCGYLEALQIAAAGVQNVGQPDETSDVSDGEG